MPKRLHEDEYNSNQEYKPVVSRFDVEITEIIEYFKKNNFSSLIKRYDCKSNDDEDNNILHALLSDQQFSTQNLLLIKKFLICNINPYQINKNGETPALILRNWMIDLSQKIIVDEQEAKMTKDVIYIIKKILISCFNNYKNYLITRFLFVNLAALTPEQQILFNSLRDKQFTKLLTLVRNCLQLENGANLPLPSFNDCFPNNAKIQKLNDEITILPTNSLAKSVVQETTTNEYDNFLFNNEELAKINNSLEQPDIGKEYFNIQGNSNSMKF